ncbi:MAG: hypothetical protein VW405_23605 [Rhodospirillaceae bacterium]
MTAPPTTTCPWCNREMVADPGAYYHEKDCHRRDVQRRMDEARRTLGEDSGAMLRLREELDMVSYVGD